MTYVKIFCFFFFLNLFIFLFIIIIIMMIMINNNDNANNDYKKKLLIVIVVNGSRFSTLFKHQLASNTLSFLYIKTIGKLKRKLWKNRIVFYCILPLLPNFLLYSIFIKHRKIWLMVFWSNTNWNRLKSINCNRSIDLSFIDFNRNVNKLLQQNTHWRKLLKEK